MPWDPTLTDAAAPAGLPDWNPEIDDVLVCRAVRQETHDVKSFIFSARRPCRFTFKPGQFLTLDLPIGGTAINRCYTISSSAARPHRVSITVKRVAGGPVSNWLHDTLKPGDEIRAVGPLGDFTPAPAAGPVKGEAAKFLFLSGGSGITPLMSMSRTFDDLAEDHDIVFVHAARSPADIIFRKELDLLARPGGRFRVAHVCETVTGEPGWAGFTGRLSLPMLRLIAPDLLEREIFVCGPSPFMKAVRAMLEEAGFDMTRHHQESFDFGELMVDVAAPVHDGSAPATIPEEAPGRFKVEFTKSRKVIECAAGTTILDAARGAGLRLPSSCSRGLCGTCKSKLTSGAVDMKHAGGIRQREIDQGQILLCCSRPVGDLVIDR